MEEKKAVKRVKKANAEQKQIKIGKLTLNYTAPGTMMAKLGEGEEWILLAGLDVVNVLEFLKEYQSIA